MHRCQQEEKGKIAPTQSASQHFLQGIMPSIRNSESLFPILIYTYSSPGQSSGSDIESPDVAIKLADKFVPSTPTSEHENVTDGNINYTCNPLYYK